MPVAYHLGRFPPATLDWPALIPLLGPAAAAIARYDGMLAAVPNPAVLLAPLTTQEAVLSSRIEGTQATMGDVLGFEAGQPAASQQREADIHEVLNYRAAMREAEHQLETLPLSLRVIRAAHRILLRGVRGQEKTPGEFRRTQNWIGPQDAPLAQARFVPIAPDRLPEAMAAFEAYLHADVPDELLRVAIAHAEFEALHPFHDGNGRLGRMLVPLLLWQQGLIRAPMFYISGWLEARRDEYYDRLLAVSRDDDWTGWCRFFLQALREQAEENLQRTQAVLKLHTDLSHRLPDLTRSQYAVKALDWIFATPIFGATDFIQKAGIPPQTARRFLGVLRKDGLLKELRPGSGRRSAVFAFSELLNIAEGRKVV